MAFRKGQAIITTAPLEVSATLGGTWTAPAGQKGFVKDVRSDGTYNLRVDWKGLERDAIKVKEDQIKARN